MSHASDIVTLVAALTAVPEYTTPLPPYYPLLSQAEPLTLRDIVAQKTLLRDHDNEARTQLYQVQKVMKACWQLSPTPLNEIPLGF